MTICVSGRSLGKDRSRIKVWPPEAISFVLFVSFSELRERVVNKKRCSQAQFGSEKNPKNNMEPIRPMSPIGPINIQRSYERNICFNHKPVLLNPPVHVVFD